MDRHRINRRSLIAFGLVTGAGFAARRASAQSEATPSPALALTPLPEATPRAGNPVSVVTTTPLLADLARQVGGSRVKASSILPADADPLEFEPSPQDIVRASDADLIVEHGIHLDDWAKELLANADAKAPVLVATTNVPTIKGDASEGFDQGDPHVWFDPRNVAIMTANIAQALARVDPDGTGTYSARQAAYASQLNALDAWIAAQIDAIPPARRKLVTNHDAFGYFVARYNIEFVGAVIPSLDSRAEPSAQETAALIDKIKQEGVPAIFTESTINPKLEQELGKQAGVRVIPDLYSDNLGPAGSGADTYIGMMETDVNIIVSALR